jgi:short-subunit dehydrogenase involved in D-alanine esterification of teichoic acids
MSKQTKELERLWWDWLGTSERLLRSLHEQTAALTLRRSERVAEIQPELDQMMGRMRDIDDKAAACARRLAEELGCEPSLRSLVQVLSKAEAESLQSVANRVIIAGRNVQTVVAKNQALIQQELETLEGTAALVAKEAAESEAEYGRRKPSPHTAMLVNQAV